MNVNTDRRPSPMPARHEPALPAKRRRTSRLRSSLSLLGLATAAAVACGGTSEEDGNDVPGFAGLPGGPPAGAAGTAPEIGGGGNTPACSPGAVGCVPASSETNNPSLPVTPPGDGQVGSTSCTPDSAICNGNLLQRCDGAGVALAPQDCASMGGSCGVVAGVAGCIAPSSCTPGAATCASANIVSTCGAGGMLEATRCPDGTNCTGAGQCTPVACNPAAMLSTNNGGVTVYWFNQGTYSDVRQPEEDINCSFGSDGSQTDTGQQDRVFNIPDERLFGAINGTDYNNAAACGACVELNNNQNGQRVTITVVDSCLVSNNNPTCTQGHIDLSRAAFEQLTNQSTGDVNNISWRFVPCAGDTGVQFQLKKPDDQYWNQFIVLNHRYPIARAEVEMEPGRWVEARRESYNYWLPTEGNNGEGGDMGTYKVRVTDVNGAIIEEQLELRAGPQGGNGQFACQ